MILHEGALALPMALTKEDLQLLDGNPIAYQHSGNGPPLVLVHGTTADHTRWQLVLAALEQHFTVYAMDRRGPGESGDKSPTLLTASLRTWPP